MRTTKLLKPDGSVLAGRCLLAVRPWSRMRGLLGRSSLAPDEAMLFRPAGSIHMMFMRFTIDAVFCDRELVVLEVVSSLRPWRMASLVQVTASAARRASYSNSNELASETNTLPPPNMAALVMLIALVSSVTPCLAHVADNSTKPSMLHKSAMSPA